MEGLLTMSSKERRRKSVFEQVLGNKMTLEEASFLLSLSYRQCRRSFKRYRCDGDAGLVHKGRGRPSNRVKAPDERKKVLGLYKKYYEGFGPTLAAEKLLERDGIEVDHETLRRWLIADGEWKVSRKRNKHRRRRERKHHFGELVQLDGSHHRWFGNEEPECCLMNLVDDAGTTTLSLMDEEETTSLAMRALWLWIERYGVPKALYADKKSVYVTERDPTLEEQLAGVEPLTTFGKACKKLAIEIIAANSPQAKGRVERNHGVYQDRFVKELKLQRITTISGANKLLYDGFLDTLNEKFARAPISAVDFHRPVPKGLCLADVFCLEETRTVQNDWCIRFENHYYQIEENNRPLPRPKDRITVRTRLDGTRLLLYKDKPLVYRQLGPAAYHKQTQTTKTKKLAQMPLRQVPKQSPWRHNCVLMAADTGKKNK